MVNFGENIYLWRTFRGLTQKDLAKISGIPRPNLSVIEGGKREPSLETLRQLAVSLGTNTGSLIDGIPPEYFKPLFFSRDELEKIAQLSLGEVKGPTSCEQEFISSLLTKIISNRINAARKIYKKTLKSRHTYINSWLILKAALGEGVLNNILTRLDKHIQLYG